MSGRVHLLTQFVWPDAAPTAIYAEQLADALTAAGHEVVLVGGQGAYRRASRERPTTRITSVEHRRSDRKKVTSVAVEYVSITRAFQRYLVQALRPGDVVVCTSAPPSSFLLWREVARRRAVGVYWLQDYYPELLRGFIEYPRPVRAVARRLFDQQLARWDVVVKIGGNLGYAGANARVIRNWPTLSFPQPLEAIPKTALYSGNLGYGHHLESLLARCRELVDDGYRVTIRGDGPGMSALPPWVTRAAPVASEEELRRSYLEAEVHLVAAHPELREAVFPSKIWNSLAAGRRLVCTGFTGEMATELQATLASEFSRHLPAWVELVSGLANRSEG